MSNKVLYIIRGVPGSGKSTIAHKLTDYVAEADMFMFENGEYKWSKDKLHMAHKKCEELVEQYMIENKNKIAVSNTCIKVKEMKPYLKLAEKYGYSVEIIELNGGYKSIHNVPETTMERMKQTFQPYDRIKNN